MFDSLDPTFLSLTQALYQNPTDWDRYFIISDFLTDYDQLDLAISYRWLGVHYRCPNPLAIIALRYSWHPDSDLDIYYLSKLPIPLYNLLIPDAPEKITEFYNPLPLVLNYFSLPQAYEAILKVLPIYLNQINFHTF